MIDTSGQRKDVLQTYSGIEQLENRWMSLLCQFILHAIPTFVSHSRVEAMGTEAIRSIRDQVSDSPILPQPEVIIPGL